MKDILSGIKHILYIYSHPFDGFWVMKREKIGGIRFGLFVLLLLVVTTSLRILNTGYLFDSGVAESFSVWMLALLVAVLVALYCVANWALTTLIDGMGNFTEIFVTLMYAATPIVIANIPLTVFSNFFVLSEASYYTFINAIIILFSVFLLLAGNMTIHEFTMFKSIWTLILTVLAMLAIAVMAFLAFNLIQQVWLFILSLFSEISFRIS